MNCSSEGSLLLSIFPQIACSSEESHTIFQRRREKLNDSPRVCIIHTHLYIVYIYIRAVGESTWYYVEEESCNRKRFTPTRTSPRTLLIVPCRVSKRRGRDGGIAPFIHFRPVVSATINTRRPFSPIVRSRVFSD